MKGKVIKQINNLKITQTKDGMYHVYTPNNLLIMTTFYWQPLIDKCNACTTYLGNKALSDFTYIAVARAEFAEWYSIWGQTKATSKDKLQRWWHRLCKESSVAMDDTVTLYLIHVDTPTLKLLTDLIEKEDFERVETIVQKQLAIVALFSN